MFRRVRWLDILLAITLIGVRSKYVGINCIDQATNCGPAPCGLSLGACRCDTNAAEMDVILAFEQNPGNGLIKDFGLAKIKSQISTNSFLTILSFTNKTQSAGEVSLHAMRIRSNDDIAVLQAFTALPTGAIPTRTALKTLMEYIYGLTTNTTLNFGKTRPVSVVVFTNMNRDRYDALTLNNDLCRTTGSVHMGDAFKASNVFVHFQPWDAGFNVVVNKNLASPGVSPGSPFSGSDIVSCFVHDKSTDILPVVTILSALTQSSRFLEILCPRLPFVTITEVQVSPATSTGIVWPAGSWAPYVEFFNYGPAFPASELQFSGGLITGNLTAASSVMIKTLEYFVIHGAGAAFPDCRTVAQKYEACNCQGGVSPTTFGSHLLCPNASYIGCGTAALASGSNFGADMTGCTFTVTASGWRIELGRLATSTHPFVVVESATHATTENGIDYWPSLPSNLTTEYPPTFTKLQTGYTSLWGTNWAVTCTSPGAISRVTCPKCTILDTCGAGTCNPGGQGSPCTCPAGYYILGTDGTFFNLNTCNRIPVPYNCSKSAPGGQKQLTLSWVNPNFGGRYQVGAVFPNSAGDGTTSIQAQGEPYIQSPGSIGVTTITPEVVTATTQQGLGTVCNESFTAGPSMAPTRSPTFSIPTVPTCTVTLFPVGGGQTRLDITWTNITGANGIPGEIRYETTVPGTLTTIQPCCTQIRTLADNVYYASPTVQVYACPPQALSSSGQCRGINQAAGWESTNAPKTTCNVTTQAPTSTPTDAPTTVPTVQPTKIPTSQPTASPTYEPLNITFCNLIFNKQTDRVVQVQIGLPSINNATVQDISTSSLNYFLRYNFNGTLQKIRVDWVNYPAGLGSATLDAAFNITKEFNNIFIQAEPVNADSRFSGGVATPLTPCISSSSAPTSVPTGIPSTLPTFFPTTSPSGIPSGAPTTVPTQSPTYLSLQVQSCKLTVTSLTEVEVTWVPPAIMTFLLANQGAPQNATLPGVGSMRFAITVITNNVLETIRSASQTATGQLTRSFDPRNSSHRANVRIQYTVKGPAQPLNPIVWCNTTTSPPTKFPTVNPTKAPTHSPTWGAPNVYLELETCPNRCECCTSLVSPTCTGNAPPYQRVSESATDTIPIAIRRLDDTNGPQYPHNITVHWRIRLVDKNVALLYNLTGAQLRSQSLCTAAGDQTTQSPNATQANNTVPANLTKIFFPPVDAYFNWLNESKYNCSSREAVLLEDPSLTRLRNAASKYWDPLTNNSKNKPDFAITSGLNQLIFGGPTRCDIYQDKTKSWSGSVLLPGKSNGRQTVELLVPLERRAARVQDDLEQEAFLIEITECTVGFSSSRFQMDNRSCNVIYPQRAFIAVVNRETFIPQASTTIPNTDFLRWLPWVLLGICLFLCLLTYLLYRLYVNYKLVKSEKQMKERERDQALVDREEGFGKDLGEDQIQVNPLATGIPQFAKNQKDTWLKTELDSQQNQIERAEVRVDRFNVRQEFGPTQKTATGTDMGYSSQMLI